MTEPRRPRPRSTSHSYSPQLRTALILTGTGTAGAYHAGVLRALHEAGVKIDLVAAHGMGLVGALFAAVDGTQRLWEEKGFWQGSGVKDFYPWHRVVRVGAGALALSLAVVLVPMGVVAIGLVVYPIDFVLKMVGLGGVTSLIGAYLRLTQWAFAPEVLPTWLPRIVVLLLGFVAAVAAATAGLHGMPRRQVGGLWWRLIVPPLSAAEVTRYWWQAAWDLLRGAVRVKPPPPLELSRRYTELLGENLGQPGFRELIVGVHDLDAGRDLVFALVTEPRRAALVRRATSQAAEERRAEVFDLSGLARDYLPAVIAGALAIPLATEPGQLTFVADAYWRGETHRLCDRPALVARLLEEVIELEAEQVLVVSAAPATPGPHALSPGRLDGRGRVGEYLRSAEASAVRDAIRLVNDRPLQIYAIRPDHNPLGPFDFAGGFDARSNRRQPLGELMSRGYEDAYRQFIEPVVGASEEA